MSAYFYTIYQIVFPGDYLILSFLQQQMMNSAHRISGSICYYQSFKLSFCNYHVNIVS